jgi:hypothetical protein
MPRLDKTTSRSSKRLRIILCLAALWLILPSAAFACWNSFDPDKASSRSSPAVTVEKNRGCFRTGQWRADALTLVAAARWYFEPEISGI